MRPAPILDLELSVNYAKRPGVLRGVRLTIAPGEIVGLVGQSGSGKSTLALSILRLLQQRQAQLRGHVHCQGRDLLRLSERDMRGVRGREIGLVLQNPLASLNPALRIGTQLAEAWRAHVPKASAVETEQQSLRALAEVSLPADKEFLRRYPQSLSVGMAQRVLIAMAAIHRPALLIADEPTSALDALTQAEILQLFRRLNEERGMAMLYISHDLLSVASLCHRVAILHQGEIVEQGSTESLFRAPQHPYTEQLLAALPRIAWRPAPGTVPATGSLERLQAILQGAPASDESHSSSFVAREDA